VSEHLTIIEELRELAGVPRGTNTFALEWQGVRVNVRFNDGSSKSLTLETPYDDAARAMPPGAAYRNTGRVFAIRPMKVSLVSETNEHVVGKAEGDVELQTGDAPFDAKVYIDAPTTPPAALFASDDMRAAVLELLALGFMMQIDDDTGLVTATRHSFSSMSVEQREGRRALHAFSRMAKGMPPVSSTGGKHPGEALGLSTRIAAILGAITFFGGMPVLRHLRRQTVQRSRLVVRVAGDHRSGPEPRHRDRHRLAHPPTAHRALQRDVELVEPRERVRHGGGHGDLHGVHAARRALHRTGPLLVGRVTVYRLAARQIHHEMP
jgi:hypothetical protein